MRRSIIAVLLSAMACSYCVAEGNGPLLKPRNPQIGSKGKLIQDIQSLKALQQILDDHIKTRRQRLEQAEKVPLTQEDLDVLHDFAVRNNQSEAALTAKLIIGVLLARDAPAESLVEAVPILDDLADTFPDTWQGALAAVVGISIKRNMAEKQTGHQDPVLLNAESDALERGLERARELDESRDALIHLVRIIFTGNPKMTFVAALLEALDKVHEQQAQSDAAPSQEQGTVETAEAPDAKQRPRINLDNLRLKRRQAR